METRTSYQTNGTGRPLLSMVPDGKRPEEFADNLANRFKRVSSDFQQGPGYNWPNFSTGIQLDTAFHMNDAVQQVVCFSSNL